MVPWLKPTSASAEGGIYTYVAGLRRVIEPNRSLRGPGRVLVSSGAGYVLHLVPGQPDAVAFEQDLGRARQLRKAEARWRRGELSELRRVIDALVTVRYGGDESPMGAPGVSVAWTIE